MFASNNKHLSVNGNRISVREIPTFSFEHWKGNNSHALTKLVKKTDDPLVAFKSFMNSKSMNYDMVLVSSSYEYYVDPLFTVSKLRGWSPNYGLPYAYVKFLEACDLEAYYDQIPMDDDITKIKKAPLRA